MNYEGEDGGPTLAEVLDETDPIEFCNRMVLFVGDRVAQLLKGGETDVRRRLSEGEWKIHLYSALILTAEGWLYDLFYQELDLDANRDLIAFLDELGLQTESEMLAEALHVYCRRNKTISQQEYQLLPSSDLTGKDGDRFDEISRYFKDGNCGIWGDSASEKIARWAKANGCQFERNKQGSPVNDFEKGLR